MPCSFNPGPRDRSPGPNRRRRRPIPAWIVAIAAAVLSIHAAGVGLCDDAARVPNIVLIMADDHAAHALGCYGSRINRTPNLDRLAREGMRFANCFCTNSICAPSRAVILTGRYSRLNGVRDNRKAFDGSQVTFPKLLQQAGYQTALIGKWHLKSPPTGFDYWSVLPGQGRYRDPVLLEMGRRRQYRGYVTDVITDLCIKWLKQQGGGRPFCLLYHHKAPHANWEPDPKHARLYEDRDIAEPDTLFDDFATRTGAIRTHTLTLDANFTQRHRRSDPPESLQGADLRRSVYQRFIKDYLRCIASVDENVGRLLRYLDDAGLARDTVVIYTSDQGFFLGDHGMYDKRFMYEESLRMPLLVRYPRRVAPGSVAESMVLNLDFAPTLLDLAGAPIPREMQGRSFVPVLRGKTPADWRRSMYYRFYESAYGVGPHHGIRTDRYKLIHFLYGDSGWELYDLKADPRELLNIYERPDSAAVVARLKTEMKRLQQQVGDPGDP